MSTVDDEGLVARPVDDSLLGERDKVAAALFGRQASPKTIGRYAIEDVLGRGAMGVVYEAWDEELQRTVAVKLISRDVEMGDAEARFKREALALAKLAHPNVVTIHEVGTHEGRMFIAMELVRGQTLDTWLRAEERSWQTILDVFVQAGRGLVAAHAAGLVHRDFKPANCIVGESGRVRVLDFGLARGVADLLDEEVAATQPTVSTLDISVTRTGATVGTPAYMAPEQLRGEEASAASDQFAFCVALYEALVGVRPFAGRSVIELHQNIERGVLQPGDASVPKGLLRLVERGLALTSKKRWPSVGDLVEAAVLLPRRRASRRRAWSMAGGGLVAAAVAAAAWLPEAPCQDVRTTRVWSEGAQDRLEAVMKPAPLWRTLDGSLRSWAAEWNEARTETCVASRLEARISNTAESKRVACLRRQEQRVRELVSALEVSPVPQRDTPALLSQLPDIEQCRLMGAQRGEAPPDGEAADAVFAAREQLYAAVAAEAVGEIDRARQLLEPARSMAEQTRYAPLLSEVSIAEGIFDEHDDVRTSRERYRRAFELADGAGADEFAADAALHLAGLAVDMDDHRSAEDWRSVAEGKLHRLGAGAGPRRRLAVLTARIHLLKGDGQAALGAVAQAMASCPLSERTIVPCGDLLAVRALAFEHGRSGDEAEEAHSLSIESFRRFLGPSHEAVGASLFDRGLFRFERGDFDGARHDFDAAHEVLAQSGRKTILARLVMAQAQLESMDGGLSVETLARAREAVEGLDSAHPNRLPFLEMLASFQLRLGQLDDSMASYGEILRAYRAQPEPDPIAIAMTLSNIGECELELGRDAEALRRFESALEHLASEVASDDLRLAYPLTGLGRALLRRGELERARPLLERSLTLRNENDPLNRAQTKWALARVLGVATTRGTRLSTDSVRDFESAQDLQTANAVKEQLAKVSNDGTSTENR